MSILDSFLGKVRAPWYAQLTIDTRTGKLHLHFKAQSESGGEAEFSKEYDSPMVTGQVVQDLLGWLKETAVRFFGSVAGGL